MRRNPFPATEKTDPTSVRSDSGLLASPSSLASDSKNARKSSAIRNSLLTGKELSSLLNAQYGVERKSPLRANSFIQSVGFALKGMRYLLKEERNFRIHVLLAGFVFSMAMLFQFAAWEWIVLLIGTAVMLSTEAFNTAVECLVDLLVGEKMVPLAGQIKDITAAACLMTAMALSIVGIVLFWPHLLLLVQH